jgi:subtilisin
VIDTVTSDWAWGGSTGAGVRVAVIDSGVETSHPALGGCVDAAASVVVALDDAGTAAVRAEPHDDLFGHGTACAGLIHAIAPDARITSVRVLDARLAGKAAVFHRALQWAVEQRFDVINLSLGTTKREWALAFYEACDAASFGGSVVVTAANNVARPSFPSLYASVISVASHRGTDPFAYEVNPSPPTDLLAPGIDVPVAWRGGTTIKGTGNSYAAPAISGIAALVRAKHPSLRPFQVKAALHAAASTGAAPARRRLRPSGLSRA